MSADADWPVRKTAQARPSSFKNAVCGQLRSSAGPYQSKISITVYKPSLDQNWTVMNKFPRSKYPRQQTGENYYGTANSWKTGAGRRPTGSSRSGKILRLRRRPRLECRRVQCGIGGVRPVVHYIGVRCHVQLRIHAFPLRNKQQSFEAKL